MFKKNPVSDQAIMTKVNQQLQSRGIRSPCHVGVMSLKGMVTLSGTIQYDHQRIMAVHATQNVEGVQRVVDHMQLIAKTSHWK
ncbi:MAG: BON domain-containing protein [Thermoguttaceae bacterium]